MVGPRRPAPPYLRPVSWPPTSCTSCAHLQCTMVLTLQPAALERGVTYSVVITRAKALIDLEALKTPRIRIRDAAPGASVVEVPGAATKSGAKADILARELEKALGQDDIKIARPTKSAELRLLSLAWVRCQVATARKIFLGGGSLKVGWSMARVELLEARPYLCFRCLEPGHAQVRCPSEVDSSDLCYR